MKYGKICKAEFIERPNRFVAVVRLKEEGGNNRRGSEPREQIVRVHVKNTGRCRELLVPGAEVILEDFRDRMGSRKMEYSLIAVYKYATDRRNGQWQPPDQHGFPGAQCGGARNA